MGRSAFEWVFEVDEPGSMEEIQHHLKEAGKSCMYYSWVPIETNSKRVLV